MTDFEGLPFMFPMDKSVEGMPTISMSSLHFGPTAHSENERGEHGSGNLSYKKGKLQPEFPSHLPAKAKGRKTVDIKVTDSIATCESESI